MNVLLFVVIKCSSGTPGKVYLIFRSLNGSGRVVGSPIRSGRVRTQKFRPSSICTGLVISVAHRKKLDAQLVFGRRTAVKEAGRAAHPARPVLTVPNVSYSPPTKVQCTSHHITAY